MQGVDVWINTPRRPWEACGTSGMKVLVNGGLNLSELDGWWAEAYSPEVGWAIGDGKEHDHDPDWDAIEANQLYDLLEKEIIPEFYDRNFSGLPVKWVARVRASMSRLTPCFSSNRMLRDYVENIYIPATVKFRKRVEKKANLASELDQWQSQIANNWDKVHIGKVTVSASQGIINFEHDVTSANWHQIQLTVEIYADKFQEFRHLDKVWN